MEPVDIKLIMPGAHADDVAFIQEFLVLDPAKRMSALNALTVHPYFVTVPFPCSPWELSLPDSLPTKKATRRKFIASVDDVLSLEF